MVAEGFHVRRRSDGQIGVPVIRGRFPAEAQREVGCRVPGCEGEAGAG